MAFSLEHWYQVLTQQRVEALLEALAPGEAPAGLAHERGAGDARVAGRLGQLWELPPGGLGGLGGRVLVAAGQPRRRVRGLGSAQQTLPPRRVPRLRELGLHHQVNEALV